MRNPHVSQWLPGALALGLVALWAGAAVACPNCKAALAENSEGGADLVRGYFYSILFMMSMPFTILGAFSFSMYRAVKKARLTAAASQDEQPSEEF